MKNLKGKIMWNRIKEFILNKNIESWLGLYFLINMITIYFTQDMNSTNILIQFYVSFILTVILNGLATLRYENAEIKKIIKEKLTK